MSSAQRKKDILERTKTDKGYSVYKIKPGDITQKDINYMVNVINKRLYNIEKKGLTEASNEYRSIEQYATEGSPFYNYNPKTGTIRVRSSLKSFKGREREKYINTLRNIMRAKTSTATGTKRALEGGYKTFLERYGFTKKQLPKEKYAAIWQIWKDKIRVDRRDKFGSDKVISMLEYGQFGELSIDEMQDAMEYIAQNEADLDAYEEWLDLHKQSN